MWTGGRACPNAAHRCTSTADTTVERPLVSAIVLVELDKGPRLFVTLGCDGQAARWAHVCCHGVGAGDMVHGLMRIDARFKAGIFRRVRRPVYEGLVLTHRLRLRGGGKRET